MNCGQRFCTISASKRRPSASLPGAEQPGAAPHRDQAAVPVGADPHLPDRRLDERPLADPELGVHLAPEGLVLALAAWSRRSGGRPGAPRRPSRPSASSAGSPRKTQSVSVKTRVSWSSSRSAQAETLTLLKVGMLREALDQRLGDHASRRAPRGARPSPARAGSRAGGRRRRPARRPGRRPRRAGSRPAASPRSRACRARRRSGRRCSRVKAPERVERIGAACERRPAPHRARLSASRRVTLSEMAGKVLLPSAAGQGGRARGRAGPVSGATPCAAACSRSPT